LFRPHFNREAAQKLLKLRQLKVMAGFAPAQLLHGAEAVGSSTVPDSFHKTNPINAFRGIFGLKRAVI